MPAEGTEFVSLAQLKDYDTNRVATGLGLKLDAPASAGTEGQMLVYGASGNQWADVPDDTAYSADDETIQLSGTQFSVKDGGITAAKIASGAVTADKMASGVIPDVSDFVTQTQVDEINSAIATTKWLKPENEIPSGTDLDTLTEPGSWFCDDSTSVTNVPGGVAAEFLLYVYSVGGVVAHELHTPFGTWWRWKNDGYPWGTWIRVLAPDGPLPLKDGGTGADNAADARSALGLASIYTNAPYVKSKSSSARLVTGTSVITFTQGWSTLLNDTGIRTLVGRSFDQARDSIAVMNGDKTVQEDAIISAVFNATSKEINLRAVVVSPMTNIIAVSGPMRINYILATG